MTFRTTSHGIIVKTLKALNESGYIQNFSEHSIKKRRVIAPKLAFANLDINKKVAMHDMSFQISDKPMDFEDEEFRRKFPMVFSKRGILASQRYRITKDENSEIQIEHLKEKGNMGKQNLSDRVSNFRKSLSANISQEKQSEFSKEFGDKALKDRKREGKLNENEKDV